LDQPALNSPQNFINRELSSLEFNRRVLAQALKAHPEAFAAMLKIAEEYDRLAVHAEQRINSAVDDTTE